MWFKLRIISIVLLIAILGLAKPSDASQKEELIRSLMTDMNIVEMTKQSTEVMMQQMKLIMASQLSALSPTYGSGENKEKAMALIKKSINSMISKMSDQYMQQMDFEALVEQVYIPVYDKYYTKNEIEDLSKFYRSSTGKKTLETMPALLAETMEKAAVIIQPLMVKISTAVRAEETKVLIEQLEALKEEQIGTDPV